MKNTKFLLRSAAIPFELTFELKKGTDEKIKTQKKFVISFINESRLMCGYEILTDELCCLVGLAIAYLGAEFPWVRADLDQLQPWIYHKQYIDIDEIGSLRVNH